MIRDLLLFEIQIRNGVPESHDSSVNLRMRFVWGLGSRRFCKPVYGGIGCFLIPVYEDWVWAGMRTLRTTKDD